MKRTPMPKARKPMRRRKPVKRVNPIRKAVSFANAYHSDDRCRWVRALPCCNCAKVGISENAHIETAGMGLKAHYSKVVPLCCKCHATLHYMGRKSFEGTGPIRLNLAKLATLTEAKWQAYLASRSPRRP